VAAFAVTGAIRIAKAVVTAAAKVIESLRMIELPPDWLCARPVCDFLVGPHPAHTNNDRSPVNNIIDNLIASRHGDNGWSLELCR
jgi:hypothetical protein